jgi:hypothetical protein
MNENQLTVLPDSEENERLVVDRVDPCPPELIPGVQVTLAKRIIHPGSNRVMCLAAQTSVPVQDDQIASVSDLAVRLSDGTNVRLSLSFFNEAVGANFNVPTFRAPSFDVPFSRPAYDPERYRQYSEDSRDSKLGPVLFGMCLVALAGVTFAFYEPISNYFHPKPVVKTTDKNPGKAEVKEVPPASQVIYIGGPIPNLLTPHHAVSSTPHHAGAKHAVRSGHHSAAYADVSSPSPRDNMLVPPPPPIVPDYAQFVQPPVLAGEGAARAKIRAADFGNASVAKSKLAQPNTHESSKSKSGEQGVPDATVSKPKDAESSANSAKAAPSTNSAKAAQSNSDSGVKPSTEKTSSTSHANAKPQAAKTQSAADALKELQSQMMEPAPATARVPFVFKSSQTPHEAQTQQQVERAQTQPAERVQPANHVVEYPAVSSGAGHVVEYPAGKANDSAEHQAAPLPGGDSGASE